MPDPATHQVVRLEQLTRREMRERIQDGTIRLAILPVGSIEQHLEHMAMGHDINHSTYVAEQVALNVHPHAVVAVPMAIGMSEHHMVHIGSMTAKPGSWLAVLFDSIESFLRAGIPNVLVLNGHGGNVAPTRGAINQFNRYFDVAKTNVQFMSYWDVIPRELSERVLDTKRIPGHAQEFETSTGLYLFPDNVRVDRMGDEPEAAQGTAEKGKVLIEAAIAEVTRVAEAILAGERRAELTGL